MKNYIDKILAKAKHMPK